MAEFFLFGFQVPYISCVWRDFDRHARHVHPVTAQALDLVRVVGEQLNLADTEVAQPALFAVERRAEDSACDLSDGSAGQT